MFIVLCEEIRDEVAGSRSLIGVFPPGGLRFPRLPAILPKFGVFVSTEAMDTESDVTFDVEIRDPSGKVLFVFKSAKLKHEKVTKGGFVSVNISPLQVTQVGAYSVRVTRNDGKTEVATFEVGQGIEGRKLGTN